MPDLIVKDGQLRIVTPTDVAGGSGGQYPLQNSAKAWTLFRLEAKASGWRAAFERFRSLPLGRLSYRHGRSSSLAGLICNPRFYELIMGWPIDWTAPEVPATEFAAWLQRSRGQFSKLLTEFQPEA